jgi:hypothetical protein
MPMPMPGHGDHDSHAMQCKMSMIWNTDCQGICVVFSSWQVTGTPSLAATLVALFFLSMLLEYLRLRIRSLDAQLISSYQLTNGILSALGSQPAHRRKASIQQKRHPSQSLGGSVLSSGVNTALVGDRRVPASDSVGSSWAASDDDAPLLPSSNGAREPRRPSMWSRLRHAFL